MMSKAVFLLGLALAASGFVSPPLALSLGLVFGFSFPHPFDQSAKKLSRCLLQASVVGLGFGMNLHDVVRAGRSGFVYTVLGIGFAMVVGMGLGALLGMKRTPAFLISTGTAICGGSAIAAVGPITGASDEQMAVSLGTIFVLNSVALLIFPPIGAALKLTQTQFGGRRRQIWCGGIGRGHDGEAGPSLVDRAHVDYCCLGQTRESKDPVALVYRAVLPGRGMQHVSTSRGGDLQSSFKNCQNRPHCDFVSDRYRHLASHTEKGWTSASAAGSNPMAADFGRLAVADPGGMDRFVRPYGGQPIER